MSRLQVIALGLLAGAALAVALLLLVLALSPDDDGEPEETSVPVHLRDEASVPESTPRVRTQPVTIYQRATVGDALIAPVTAQIVWIESPAARGREITRLVLEGIPGAEAAVPPVAPGLRCREVFVEPTGTAWVDLEQEGVDAVRGSDEEQSLVAALARSLVEGLDEVQRVGILVGGQPRRTLAGHVDLSRTYTGYEWPSTDDVGGVGAENPGLVVEEGAL